MQFRQLRRILQRIVLVGLPGAGCVDAIIGADCVTTESQTIVVTTPAMPPMQLRIDSCRVDVDACPELCAFTMQSAGIPSTAKTCAVTFEGASTNVMVTYDVYNGGPNCPVDGRRPSGLAQPSHLGATSPAGAWLAQAAWLEAASVHAFVHLARELGDHGGPQALVRAALAAARDEVRHTAMVAALAQRYGARPPAVEVTLPPPRSIEAIALENATEGCVRETWGAVIALWQAHSARDPEVRAAFAVIAKDEARHAGLAWAVDQWAMAQLDAGARARVDAAREATARELLEAPEAEALLALGLPDPINARGLVARTYEALWTARRGGTSCRV